MPIVVKFHKDAILHSLSHFRILDNDVKTELIKVGISETDIAKQLQIYGSKFYESFARSPQDVLIRLQQTFPERFENIQFEEDKRARLSFQFDTPVGISNIIDIADLTAEECKTIREEDRNGYLVRTVETRRSINTYECQLILATSEDGYEFCSTFPGELAPPLQRKGYSSPYWDTHLFIRQL